jgi:hypothetical protein
VSEATIRAQIKTVLDTVTNVGRTHDYLRWAIDETAFDDLFGTSVSDTDQYRGWMIAWLGFTQEEPYTGRDSDQYRTHTFQIDGYLGLKDSKATEKTFAALTEAVCNALDADSTINSSDFAHMRMPVQCIADSRLFYGKLCHHAEITLQVVETI